MAGEASRGVECGQPAQRARQRNRQVGETAEAQTAKAETAKAAKPPRRQNRQGGETAKTAKPPKRRNRQDGETAKAAKPPRRRAEAHLGLLGGLHVAVGLVELLLRAELARVEHIEHRPQLTHVAADGGRRAREHAVSGACACGVGRVSSMRCRMRELASPDGSGFEPCRAALLERGAGQRELAADCERVERGEGLGVAVLEAVGLVEHDVVPSGHLAEDLSAIGERLVRRDADVELGRAKVALPN